MTINISIKSPKLRGFFVALIFTVSPVTHALPQLGLGQYGPGVQDGSAPFDIDKNCANPMAVAAAGDDCGESNLQVRSQDSVRFNWSVIANTFTPGQENPKNVMLEQILHPSANAVIDFEKIPARCTPDGGGGTNPASSLVKEANGDVKLSCNLGEFAEGSQVSFSTVATISGESWNGETFTSTQRVYSNADDGSANAITSVSPDIGPITISSRPALDLSSSQIRGYYVYGKRDVGHGPENGYYSYYSFRVGTNQKTGTESIPQPFSFTSELIAKKLAENGDDYIDFGMEYYMTQCMFNPSAWGEETYGKESYGSAPTYPLEKKVIQSGTCAYVRTDPNHKASAYTMTVSGADLSGSRYPTKTIDGSDLSAGPYYYINMRVQFFIPLRVIDNADGSIDGAGNIYISNILKNFDPNGVSGSSNYGAGNEPGYNGSAMPDGSISNNIAPPYNYLITTKGTFSSSFYKDDTDTGWNYHYLDGQSWHTGGGIVGPGQAIVKKLFYQNAGATDLTDARSCIAFDNTTMKLTDRGNTGATPGKYAYVGEYTGNGLDYNDYVVEYGHVDFTGDDPLDKDGDGNPDYNNQTGRYEGKWDAQATVRCDDVVTSWHTDPNAVSGGIDAVNMVRTRVLNPATPFEPSDYLRLNAPMEMRNTFNGGPHNGEPIPNGTVLASFASVRSDEWKPGWYARYYKPSPETGNSDGDRVTFTRVNTAIDSESLLPVAAPGATASTVAGNQIVWKVNSAISTILTTPPTITNLQIINELPPQVSYNKNCTTTYQDAGGNIIGTPANIVEHNTDRDGNAKPGYTRLIWNLGTWTANVAIPPRVICTDSDSVTPGGTAVINYAEIRADDLAGAASERSDTHTITLDQTGSIQVSKTVDTTLDDVNDTQVYTLSWANFAPSFPVNAPTVIDVFPFNGDDGTNSARLPKSEFTGLAKLTGAPSITWLDGSTTGAPLGTWFYTTDAPATINYDPDNNTSNWVLEAALGGDFSQVTAVKFVSNYQLEQDGDPRQGMKAALTLQVGDASNPNSADANKPGEIYSNRFTLDTTSFLQSEQFLRSNTVSVSIASYSVGDLIFADTDGDLKFTAGTDVPAPDGIVVQLHKASDDSIVDTVTTGGLAPGRYLFTDVGSGDYYITIPASQFADGAALKGWDSLVTTAGVDDDLNEDVGQDGYTVGTVLNDGVRTQVFTLSAIPPLPGEVPKGNEPLSDNTGSIIDTTDDDFSNYTFDIGLKPALDYGDAPSSYGQAGHAVAASPSVYLGAISPDTEAQSQNTANGGLDGLGDDQTGVYDEDSIQLLPQLRTQDTSYQVNVSAHNSSAKEATLMAWIDFNNNSVFDATEATSVTVAAGEGGTKELQWNSIPAGTIQTGNLWMRIRISTDANLTADNAGIALADGEVEDYSLNVGNGIQLSGYVFNDANVSGGTKEASEQGLAGVTVLLRNMVDNSCIGVKTNADGYYQFSDVAAGSYRLYESANANINPFASCSPSEKDPQGYRSTTANSRDVTVVGTDIVNQDFGDVALPTFEADNTGSVIPGGVVFYTHKFTPYSSGSVNFSTIAGGAAIDGWNNTIYEDSNCNGQLDGGEAIAPIAGNLPTTAGASICIINKVFAPANVARGITYSNQISAQFDFTNVLAGSTTLHVTDLTKASANDDLGSSRLELKKTVQNLTQSSAEVETQNQGKPGDVLKYRIYYSNTGTNVITDLSIRDVMPPFTTLNGVPVCETPLPASLTNCTPTVNGGNLEWVFPANDALSGGNSGVVSYEVIIDN